MRNCIFCNIYSNHKERIIAQSNLAFAIHDFFPVNEVMF